MKYVIPGEENDKKNKKSSFCPIYWDNGISDVFFFAWQLKG